MGVEILCIKSVRNHQLQAAGPGHGARAAMERAALIEVETGMVPIFREILSATPKNHCEISTENPENPWIFTWIALEKQIMW